MREGPREAEFEMGRLKVAACGDILERDGRPFFLLSDTDWMAFQKLTPEEWRELVVRRRQQGFNALQISVMPIAHDNSDSEQAVHPFAVKDGKYQFTEINSAYFDRAEAMLEIMREYDMIPFLHLFWVNYIPDTWAAKISPGTVIPFERVRPLAEYMIDRFRKYEPIYSVSGDTGFETERVVEYYKEILDVLYEKDPEGLTTLHLKPEADPPEILRKHPQYHCYAYQSGHGIDETESVDLHSNQSAMLTCAGRFLEKAERKPIINTEPCYEGHGFGFHYGKFNAYDIRRVAWTSLLSGAKAGISYGAHGVWQMHRRGENFNNMAYSGMPYDWRAALQFPGAWDVGFVRWLFVHYDMFSLKPSDALEARSSLIRMAESDDRIVIYMPYQDECSVLRDLSGYCVEMIALETKKVLIPLYTVREGKTYFSLSDCNEDMLIIARR